MRTLARMSWFNRVGLMILAVGTILLAVAGQWQYAAVIAAALVVLAVFVARSLRGGGSDADRVNAAQPFDERDAAAVEFGFALVGKVALLAQLTLTIWALAFQESAVPSEAARLLVLGLVLGAANEWKVRRG